MPTTAKRAERRKELRSAHSDAVLELEFAATQTAGLGNRIVNRALDYIQNGDTYREKYLPFTYGSEQFWKRTAALERPRFKPGDRVMVKQQFRSEGLQFSNRDEGEDYINPNIPQTIAEVFEVPQFEDADPEEGDMLVSVAHTQWVTLVGFEKHHRKKLIKLFGAEHQRRYSGLFFEPVAN